MSPSSIVGLKPQLPGSLKHSSWWTTPIRAERLAALRIGVGLALLIDILLFYLPYADLFFSHANLGGTHGIGDPRPLPLWSYSPLGNIASAEAWYGILALWALMALGILLGVWPRVCAAAALLLAGAIYNANPLLMNGGDNVRHILLLYLIFTPCGVVWTIQLRVPLEPVFIWPWAIRLLFVQMVVIYFVTGISKLSPIWLNGEAIYYVMASLDWTRWSLAILPLPAWLMIAANWLTLAFEIGFPILMLHPRTRRATLWLGVLFHVGTGVALKLGPFPLYMLCLYLPLVPWERYFIPRTVVHRRRPSAVGGEVPITATG